MAHALTVSSISFSLAGPRYTEAAQSRRRVARVSRRDRGRERRPQYDCIDAAGAPVGGTPSAGVPALRGPTHRITGK